MTLTERVRSSLPQQPRLRRISLRTKLVASVLILVFAALTLISAASTVALHSYLIRRMDGQLRAFATNTYAYAYSRFDVIVPPDYLAATTSVSGVGKIYANVSDAADLPPL